MIVSKENLVKGIVKYAKQEILGNISDKPSRMVVATGIKAVEMYPELLDDIFNNTIIETVLKNQNGKYDITNAVEILKSTMDEYGDFPIQIPMIKNPLVFNKKDIDKLEECIKECAEND